MILSRSTLWSLSCRYIFRYPSTLPEQVSSEINRSYRNLLAQWYFQFCVRGFEESIWIFANRPDFISCFGSLCTISWLCGCGSFFGRWWYWDNRRFNGCNFMSWKKQEIKITWIWALRQIWLYIWYVDASVLVKHVKSNFSSTFSLLQTYLTVISG